MASNCSNAKRKLEKSDCCLYPCTCSTAQYQIQYSTQYNVVRLLSISLYYITIQYCTVHCTVRCCLTVVYIVVLIIQKQYQLPAAAEVVSVSTPATLTSPAQLCRNPDTNTQSRKTVPRLSPSESDTSLCSLFGNAFLIPGCGCHRNAM